MSLKKLFLKTKWSYHIYLIYNLYVRHKCFLKRKQYSQWGEDQEIKKFFSGKKKGIYLDIGCYHPIMYSNTCLLFNKGWQGINIDMNPTSIDLFNIARPNDLNICSALSNETKKVKVYYDDLFSSINTIDKNFYEKSKHIFKNHKVKEINSKKISDILLEKNLHKDIDFLNIDIEGLDFEILKQISTEDYKIKLIAIETHHVNGQKSEDCDNIKMWLKNRKYVVLKSTGPTTLFAKK